MPGTIRTKEKCPICQKNFDHIPKLGIICKEHKTTPNKFFIDISWKGQRLKLYSHKSGRVLDSYAIAQETLDHIRHEIRNHTFDPTDYIKKELQKFYFSIRIEEWLAGKTNEVEKGNLAPSTLKTYKVYDNKYYTPFFLQRDIREIRSFDIEQFYRQLPKMSLKYTKCLIDTLENFFNDMLRLEYIQRKPVFPEITLDEKVPLWTSREVQDTILSKIPDNDRNIFYFLSRQGIRPAEARSMKIKDIDFTNSILIIQRTFSESVLRERTKTKKVRPRLINPELLPMLKEVCRSRFPEEFVFLNPRTRKPYSDKSLNKIWNDACDAAEVNITLYNGTRHSVASIAASAGAPLQAIQAVLGHTDIRTTMKYAMVELGAQMAVFESANKKSLKVVNANQADVPKLSPK